MIHKNGKNLWARYYGRKAILFVYRGIKLIWRSVRSCFGGEGWDNNQPWDNNDGWNNG